jgi:hypothetical protein
MSIRERRGSRALVTPGCLPNHQPLRGIQTPLRLLPRRDAWRASDGRRLGTWRSPSPSYERSGRKKEKAEERRQEAGPLGRAKKAFVKAAHAEGRYPLNEVSLFGTKCRRTGSSKFVCSWLWVRSGPFPNEEIAAIVTHEHAHYYVGPFSFNE